MARLFAALMLVVASCLAAPAARAQTSDKTGNEVKGVTVVGGPGPVVQSTYPASGAGVPGGVLILKIVFDQPMAPDAWAYGPSADDGQFPQCLAEPRLLADQRTYVLLCSVALNGAFAVQINPTPRFASAYGRSAKPFVLKFSTTDSETTDLHDALQQAGLDDTDDPIMTWRDDGHGVSQTPAPP